MNNGKGHDQASSPVIIPITSSMTSENDGQTSIPEWAMIELNGELLHPTERAQDKGNSFALVGREEVELGALWFVEGKPNMIIGSHELKGTVESLKQPFCVLEKATTTATMPSSEDGMAEEAASYRIKGMITKKLLFQGYPKTILSRS